VVVLAVIVGGGILSWIKMQEVSPIELLEIKKPEKVVEDETADWKTYRNEEYGFEIKYPEEIHLDEKCTEFFDIEPDVKKICFGTIRGMEYKFDDLTGSPIIENEFILLITPPEYTSIDDYVNKQKQITKEIIGDEVNFEVEEIYVGNERGIKFTPILEDYNLSDFIVFKNGNIFIFRGFCWFRPSQCDDVFDQVLSTFRFLE